METSLYRGRARRFLACGAAALALCGLPVSPVLTVSAAGTASWQTYIDESGIFLGGGHYYRQLNDTQKKAYQVILQNVLEFNAGFSVPCPSWDDLWAAFTAVYWDHEELWWLTGTLHSEGDGATPEYLVDKAQAVAMQAEIDAQANAIVAQCPGGSSYDKVRYVYQWLVNNVDYQKDCYGNQCIYSALVRRESVCAGYARSAMYLLERLGVECIYVLGNEGDESHAWNMVKLGNDWYHVDATWGDPIVYDSVTGERIPCLDGSNIKWEFLCCTDAFLQQQRTIEAHGYPACTATDPAASALQPVQDGSTGDVPGVSGLAESGDVDDGTVLNREFMMETFRKSIGKKSDNVKLLFLTDRDYREAVTEALPEMVPEAVRELAKARGLKVAWYRYVKDPEERSVTVYWSYQEDTVPDVPGI